MLSVGLVLSLSIIGVSPYSEGPSALSGGKSGITQNSMNQDVLVTCDPQTDYIAGQGLDLTDYVNEAERTIQFSLFFDEAESLRRLFVITDQGEFEISVLFEEDSDLKGQTVHITADLTGVPSCGSENCILVADSKVGGTHCGSFDYVFSHVGTFVDNSISYDDSIPSNESSLGFETSASSTTASCSAQASRRPTGWVLFVLLSLYYLVRYRARRLY